MTAAAALFGPAALAAGGAKAKTLADRFDFAEIEAGIDRTHHVAPGYRADLLTRWPDFKCGMPPRPSVVVITRTGGGKIRVSWLKPKVS